jgi:hypothetical protein
MCAFQAQAVDQAIVFNDITTHKAYASMCLLAEIARTFHLAVGQHAMSLRSDTGNGFELVVHHCHGSCQPTQGQTDRCF